MILSRLFCISRQEVAVKTGELAQGTHFNAQEGTYEVSAEPIEAPDFLRTNAFATVLKTVYMFEEDDTLDRDFDELPMAEAD